MDRSVEHSQVSNLKLNDCEKGFVANANYLLEKGANPYEKTQDNVLLIDIVSTKGYYSIFEKLLDKYISDKETLPQNTLINLLTNINRKEENVDFEKCFDKLTEAMQKNREILDVNYIAKDKLFALYYATLSENEQHIKTVLKLGASLALKNQSGLLAIQNIDVDVLEKHLDDCVEGKLLSTSNDKDMEIFINIENLLPPRGKHKEDDEGFESDVLLFLSSSEEYQRLLNHPVVVMVLFLKWNRIHWLFFGNVLLYSLFCISLGAHTFLFSGNSNNTDIISNKSMEDERMLDENSMDSWKNISYHSLVIFFVFILIRELSQLLLTWRTYWKNLENYIELLLIILIIFILRLDFDNSIRKELLALSILPAAFELILLFGRHPKFATNVEMLHRVSLNFFKLFIWYSILIFAFILSFYIVASESEDGENSFGNIVFKTLIILIGEASAEPFGTLISRVLFCSFLFIISIILMNLLNGLAVSDTQIIKNEAELFGHIARTKYINFVERLIRSDLLPKYLKSKLTKFCSLENDLTSFKITVLPHKKGLIEFGEPEKNCWKYLSNLYLDLDSVQRAKAICVDKLGKNNINKDQLCENCVKLFEKLINKASS